MVTATRTTIKAGDIIEFSWGYEQTNIDFYKVLARKGDYVTLVELEQTAIEKLSDAGISTMTGTCTPKAETKKDAKPFRRKVHLFAMMNEERVSVKKYGSGQVWDGKPSHFTSYG